MHDRTPAERSLAARLAAHRRWQSQDPKEGTRPAREAFERRFLDEVDPERTLPETERNRRAAHARSAHFTKMALRSAQLRRERQP